MRIYKNSKFLIKNVKVIPRIMKNYFMLILGKKVLKTVEIQLTDQCQCKCIHCSFSATEKKSKKCVSFDSIKKFVDDCISLGAFHFNITGGEPLLSEDIFRLIKYIKDKKNIVSVATNGILLTKETCTKLKESGLDIIEISLDSTKESDHDKFRGKEGCFEKALQGVIYSKEANITVILNTVIRHERIRNGDLDKMVELVEKENILLNLNMACAIGKWKKDYSVLLNQTEKKYVDKLLKHPLVRCDYMSNYFKKGCAAGSEKITITPYGDIIPCPFINVAFGNVKDKSTKNIWNKMLCNSYFNKVNKACLPSEDKEFINKYI